MFLTYIEMGSLRKKLIFHESLAQLTPLGEPEPTIVVQLTAREIIGLVDLLEWAVEQHEHT